jgi:hypothetical protein
LIHFLRGIFKIFYRSGYMEGRAGKLSAVMKSPALKLPREPAGGLLGIKSLGVNKRLPPKGGGFAAAESRAEAKAA